MHTRQNSAILVVGFLGVASHVAAQATVTATRPISLPTARPSNAFNVPANFPSIGFESTFLDGYNNTFSNNLIEALAVRLGASPVIRIGGTSGDLLRYNPTQTEPAVCVSQECNSRGHFILGPSYFDALKFFFKSARFTIQAPLGPPAGSPNDTNILAYVQGAVSAIGTQNRVDAIALGNEVNWFEANASTYVANAQAIKDAITSRLDFGDAPIWEILDTASEHASTGNAPYTVKGVYDAGIDRDNRVKYVAEHYYQWDGKDPTPGIQNRLLNHTWLANKLANYMNSINYVRNTANAKYILSETGGPLGVTDSSQAFFANTIWGVDFMMYAMSKGVSRVSLVQRPTAKRSLWIPQDSNVVSGPHVQAPFYALPFVADFIAKSVSGNRGVVNIDLKTPFLSAYAMFEGQTLARIAVVNLREYNGAGTRSAVKVRFNDLGNVNQITVGRLHADAGTAAGGYDVNRKNITWAGQQWSYDVDRGQGHGSVSRNRIQVSNGAVEVVIPDTEAVIVYLK